MQDYFHHSSLDQILSKQLISSNHSKQSILNQVYYLLRIVQISTNVSQYVRYTITQMGGIICPPEDTTPRAQQTNHQVVQYSQEAIIDEEAMITKEPLTRIDRTEAKYLNHKSICSITFIIELNGETMCSYGSGMLISRNIILTAAHNVFFRQLEQQGKKANYKIYLAVSGFAQNQYQVEDWRYSKNFTTCQKNIKSCLDYCIIKLKTKVPQDEFIPVSLPCKCILQKRNELILKVFGFPAAYGNYQPVGYSNPRRVLNQYGMSKKDAIQQIQLQKKTITYKKINTIKGQSGCPLVIEDKVIGIHVGAHGNIKNVGRIITEDLLNNIEKWIKQLKGDAATIIRKPSCSLCDQNSSDSAYQAQSIKSIKSHYPSIQEDEQSEKIQSLMRKGQVAFFEQRFKDSIKSYQQSIEFYKNNCSKDSKELRNKYIMSLNQLGSCYIMMNKHYDGFQFFTKLKNNSATNSKIIDNWLVTFQKKHK